MMIRLSPRAASLGVFEDPDVRESYGLVLSEGAWTATQEGWVRLAAFFEDMAMGIGWDLDRADRAVAKRAAQKIRRSIQGSS